MSDIGGQAGGFNTPYTPARDTRVAQDQTAIRQVTPKAAPETQAETQVVSGEPDKQEIVNVVLQKRLDAQKIHQQVANDRSAQADSFTRSGEEASAGRGDKVSQFSQQVSDQNRKDQLHRERLAQNLNGIQIGQKLVNDKQRLGSGDQGLATQVSESAEDIDPDAKAKKELNSKLKKIQDRGGSKGKDFVRFVESQKNDKGLVSESISELVTGFLETLRGDAETPSEMIALGNESIRMIRDKVDPNNTEEIQAIRTSLANSLGVSAAERAELLAIRNTKNKTAARLAPPRPEMDNVKLSKQEQAIRFITSINKGIATAPWDAGTTLLAA